MALRTFTFAGVDHLWSTAANWDTGVPVDLDTFAIPLGQQCDFDVDQTAFVGLGASTINGELTASTTPGAYVLKVTAAITGTGILRAGTVGTAYPVACTFSVLLNAAGAVLNLTGSGSYQLYAADPTYKYVKLTAVEPIGETVIAVDTNVTADIWAAGNLVRIDDLGGPESEERTIAGGGIAAGTITITAGLTAAKQSGAYLFLISRNVKVIGNAGVTTSGIDTPTAGVSRAEIRGCNSGVNAGSGHTVSGTVSGCTNGLYSGSGHTISGTVSGCTYGVIYGSGHTISGTVSGCTHGVNAGSGHTISGTVSGCSSGVNSGSGHTISGTVSGCSYGVNAGSGHHLRNTVFTGNTNNLYIVPEADCNNVNFVNGVENSGYNSADIIAWHHVYSLDHNAVAGAFRAWCRGGVVNSAAAPALGGFAVVYNLLPESATYPVFMQRQYAVEPGRWLYVTAWLRKDAAMAYLPRVQIIDKYADPLVAIANVALATQSMTDSLNTWELLAVAWQNTGTSRRDVLVRAIAMNAANNVYCQWRTSQPSGMMVQ